VATHPRLPTSRTSRTGSHEFTLGQAALMWLEKDGKGSIGQARIGSERLVLAKVGQNSPTRPSKSHNGRIDKPGRSQGVVSNDKFVRVVILHLRVKDRLSGKEKSDLK
jgi:hypothetical protein